jgi:hypothetical protein
LYKYFAQPANYVSLIDAFIKRTRHDSLYFSVRKIRELEDLKGETEPIFSHRSHPIPNVLLSMYPSPEKKQEGQPGLGKRLAGTISCEKSYFYFSG